jgi:CTP synthase
MSPFQHGEVFVTDDGAETDLDLGHYERFLSAPMYKTNNFTAGQVYDRVIKNERRGEYLGGTVQVIPHVTDEIKKRLINVGEGYDICIGEIGGTVGDIEGLPFLEAIRQFRSEVGRENVVYVHLTLVPYINAAGEIKTKPTQHSVKELTNVGIQPDIIILRSDRLVDQKAKDKISLFCNVDRDCVISALDVSSIYDLPLVLHEEGLDSRICEKLNIWAGAPSLDDWRNVAKVARGPEKGKVTVAMVGKYVDLTESYKSLNEALDHGGLANNCGVQIVYVDSEDIEKNGVPDAIKTADAVLVPGGFGKRGGEGKVEAIRYSRENNIPFLGICLGLQMAVVEFSRNVLGIQEAASGEFVPESKDMVIHLMEDQKGVNEKGATMRLGAYPCALKKGSLVQKIYQKDEISERHRHRWEVNNAYRDQMEEKGMILSGVSPDNNLVEIVEVVDHPWFVGVQFHPEFKSGPLKPHPLFSSFVQAAIDYRDRNSSEDKKKNKEQSNSNSPTKKSQAELSASS